MENFVIHTVIISFFSHVKHYCSLELIKIASQTAFECETLMKSFQTVCNQSIHIRLKLSFIFYFEALCSCYKFNRGDQYNTRAPNTKRVYQMFDLYNKIGCYDSFGGKIC